MENNIYAPCLDMDTNFGEEIAPVHFDTEILDFGNTDNYILCPDGGFNANVKTKFFNTDDNNDVMSPNNSLLQTIESSYSTHSDTWKNEFNDMTWEVMKSVQFATGLQDLPAKSLYNDNFKEMDQELQNELVDHCEFSEQDIITQNLDVVNRSAFIDSLLNVVVQKLSSPLNVDLPIPEGDEASSSVNPFPCDFCCKKCSQKSNLMNHLDSHQSERPFCCALCGVQFGCKFDLYNHMKLHIGLANISDSTNNQSTTVSKVMNKCILIDSLRKPIVVCGAEPENKNDTSLKPSKKNRHLKKSHTKKDILSLGWNSKLYSKPHTCNLCNISFLRDKELVDHAHLYHIDDNINIITAQKKNSNTYELTILTNFKNDDATYPCNSCGEIFDRFDYFKRHQRQHMQKELGNMEEEVYEEVHMCVRCGIFFNTKHMLEIHTEQHFVQTNVEKISECLVCGEKFDSTNELSDHVSQMHYNTLSKYSCMFCGKYCKNDISLRKHLRGHDTTHNRCIICNKIFHDRPRLIQHIKNHGKKEVISDISGKKLANKQTKINQVNKTSHANIVSVTKNTLTNKIFSCASCDKVFKTKSSLEVHCRKHTGERPYDCEYCKKTFADTGTLRKHRRIHTGEKPYACPVCTKAFNQRVLLRGHIRTHLAGIDAMDDEVNFFKCKICGNLFQSSTEFCSHLVKHSDENTAKLRLVSVRHRKPKHSNKLGKKKKKVLSDQSDTKSLEDKPIPTLDKQGVAIQSIMNQDDLSFSPVHVTSPKKSPVKTFKIVNDELVNDKQNSSEQIPNGLKNVIPESESLSKKQLIVLKDGECSRTVVLNHRSADQHRSAIKKGTGPCNKY